MPYAFAHPAAVVPLHRLLGRRTALSALVLGSVAPDLWPLVPGLVDRRFAHSPEGLLAFALPAGLFAWLVFHGLLKRPLLDLLPPALRARLASLDPARAPHPLVVAACVLLGATTHLAWDSFTHEGSLATRYLPALEFALLRIGDYTLYVHTALQHGSTVAGTAFLAWWISRWWRQAEAVDPPSAGRLGKEARLLAALLLAAAPLVVAMLGAAGLDVAASDLPTLRRVLRTVAFDALAALLASCALYALAWHLAPSRC